MTDYNPAQAFDPTPYLTTAGERQVISFRGLLLWLRHEYPSAMLVTEQVSHTPYDLATFKAVVEVPTVAGEGGSLATGHGMATAEQGDDYYQAAERIAKIEAIAALGIGADYLPGSNYLADQRPAINAAAPGRPQEPRNQPQGSPTPQRPLSAEVNNDRPQSGPAPQGYGQQSQQPPRVTHPGEPVTPNQLKALYAMTMKLGIDAAEFDRDLGETYDVHSRDGLTKGQASAIIESLQKRIDSQGGR